MNGQENRVGKLSRLRWGELSFKEKAGNIFGVVGFITMVTFAGVISGPTNVDLAINVGLIFLGGSVGWTVGVIMSPATDPQNDLYEALHKVGPPLLGGYALGAIDFASIETSIRTASDTTILRALFFLVPLFIGFLLPFIGRQDSSGNTGAGDEEAGGVDSRA